MAWTLGGAIALACGHAPTARVPPQVTAPLPTSGLAGQQVALLPLTLLAVEDSLHWDAAFVDRRASLARADSIIGALLAARAPEISWVPPDELRRAARRAPGIATDPDQLGTAMLRAPALLVVPDPLRSQLRTLAALAGTGGSRFALVPAALIFRRSGPASGTGSAELTLALADVRTGRIDWRTVATGAGADPWSALTRAVKGLTPGIP